MWGALTSDVLSVQTAEEVLVGGTAGRVSDGPQDPLQMDRHVIQGILTHRRRIPPWSTITSCSESYEDLQPSKKMEYYIRIEMRVQSGEVLPVEEVLQLRRGDEGLEQSVDAACQPIVLQTSTPWETTFWGQPVVLWTSPP